MWVDNAISIYGLMATSCICVLSPLRYKMLLILLPLWRMADNIDSTWTNEGLICIWTILALCAVRCGYVFEPSLVFVTLAVTVLIACTTHNSYAYKVPISLLLVASGMIVVCNFVNITQQDHPRGCIQRSDRQSSVLTQTEMVHDTYDAQRKDDPRRSVSPNVPRASSEPPKLVPSGRLYMPHRNTVVCTRPVARSGIDAV